MIITFVLLRYLSTFHRCDEYRIEGLRVLVLEQSINGVVVVPSISAPRAPIRVVDMYQIRGGTVVYSDLKNRSNTSTRLFFWTRLLVVGMGTIWQMNEE